MVDDKILPLINIDDGFNNIIIIARKILIAALFFVCFSSIPQARADHFSLDKSDAPGLCKAFQKVLQNSENKGFMVLSAQIDRDEKRLLDRIADRREIVFSKRFKDFEGFTWQEVTDEEAHEKLADIIQKEKEKPHVLEMHESLNHRSYGMEFKFKKTRVDIDNDGKADNIYLETGSHPRLIMDKDYEVISEYLSHGPSYLNPFKYKGQTYFVVTSDTRTGDIGVGKPITSRYKNRDDLKSYDGYAIATVCQYSIKTQEEK